MVVVESSRGFGERVEVGAEGKEIKARGGAPTLYIMRAGAANSGSLRP